MRLPENDEGLALLERELRAERAMPDPEFAAELDRWAAEGFPRGRRPGSRETGGLLGRMRGLTLPPPRRLLAPAAALATFVVIAGTVISQGGSGGDQASSGGGIATIEQAPPPESVAPSRATDGSSAAPGSAEEAGPALQDSLDTRSGFASKGSASPSERKIAQTADL